jgi:ribosomal protein L37E
VMRASDIERREPTPTGWCERCGKVFYGLTKKFCDNPYCHGWVKHREPYPRDGSRA